MVSIAVTPPEQVRLVLEFLNTIDLRTYGAGRALLNRDELADTTSASTWLVNVGLAPPGKTLHPEAAHDIRTLRDKLRAVVAGTGALSLAPSVRFSFETSRPPSIGPAAPPGSATAAIEAVVVQASLLPEWSRVRICAAPDCLRVFYDASRNGRSRWCSMRTCGNRMKTRAYRQRINGSPSRNSEAAAAAARRRPRRANTFRLEGEYWSISADGRTFRLRDSKGLRYLARLIADPNREFHVLDLVGASWGTPGGTFPVEASHEVLDPEVRRRYKARIEDLRDQIAEAERWNDEGRLATAREELSFLALELDRTLGLGGRSRSFGSDAERARVSVTRVIKAALTRIADESPELKHHFASAVRTGTYCSYNQDPRLPIRWHL